ncbi:carboxylesterase [Acrasis kona]|uniref:Carboxylesterase n=1 Tax=Acrasis kona TaxID=1008807 RepID=A0AAW2ZID3_9EUKA
MFAKRFNIIVLAVDYSLAPEHPFPAALHDVCSSWRYVNELHLRSLNNTLSPIESTFANHIDFDRIISAGDSAGANLAYRLSILARDKHIPIYPDFIYDTLAIRKNLIHLNVSYQILLFPGTGTLKKKEDVEKAYYLDEKFLDWFWASSIGVLNETEQLFISTVVDYEFAINPLKTPQKGLPDALVVSGYRDPLFRDASQIVRQLKEEGVNATLRMYDSMHSFHIFQFLKESQDVYVQIESVLKERGLTGCK